jgi:flagellar biosynthesis/type III secretory pathway protein FliH
VFLYNYDIPGDDYIQKIQLCNQQYNREYDNIQIYRVSLAKIPENSTIELERALKLLSELDLDQYLEDDSAIVKEAADMLSTYDKSERAAELREARAKAELDKNSELEVARKQGKAIGLEEGKAIGLEEGKEENKVQTISHMKAQGLDAKTISKLTGYSLESVVKVFESK